MASRYKKVSKFLFEIVHTLFDRLRLIFMYLQNVENLSESSGLIKHECSEGDDSAASEESQTSWHSVENLKCDGRKVSYFFVMNLRFS